MTTRQALELKDDTNILTGMWVDWQFDTRFDDRKILKKSILEGKTHAEKQLLF